MSKVKISDQQRAYRDFMAANPDWVEHRDLIFCPPDADEIKSQYPDASQEVLSRCMERMSRFVSRGSQYLKMRMAGESDSMASMVALRKGPALSTDDTFFAGQGMLYDQFGSQKALDRNLEASKRHGFVPDKNDVYFPNLARFKGDPEAYVSRAQGRSYIKKLLEKRGWASEGAVNTKARQPEHDPLDAKNCVPMGNDVIQHYAAKMVAKDPSLKRLKKSELRAKVIEKHGPRN